MLSGKDDQGLETDTRQDPVSYDVKPTIQTIEDPSGDGNPQNAGRDRAAEIFDNGYDRSFVSETENKRILKRINMVLLPIMLGVYFLQQLDKSTLSYASVFGLVKDANLGGQDYSWLGSVVYIAQLVMQPVIAYFLVKLPTGKFAGIMVFCWGVVLCCMSIATNFKGLFAARFFLGCFEASVAPTFITITTMWWTRREQTYVNASWYAMNGVTNMVSVFCDE